MPNGFLKYIFPFSIIISLLGYFYLGYFFERTQFEILLLTYTILCGIFIFWQLKENVNSKQLFQIGILFRILFLCSTPFLSQDFYRFIWDGRLLFTGINPYQFYPNDLISNNLEINQAAFLVEKMGELSASHYSNYPPLNQFLFLIAAFFSSKSVFGSMVILKIMIIISDIGIYFYGKKVLNFLGQNENKIFWYFLNPLVIIELSGNLHFEGAMLFFLLLGVYFLIKEKLFIAAISIAFSISIKLLPLLLLPLFFKKLKFKKAFLFYAVILLTNLLLFLPFINSELINNYTKTVGLWFTNFEFNASIYYLIREIGFWIMGYNIIGIVGKFIPIIIIFTILYLSFFKNNQTIISILQNALFCLAIYFFISTTIHPWYVINLVFLGVFTNFKFPIVWSFAVILSYYAYSVVPFKENLILILVEYLLVFGFIAFEIYSIKKERFYFFSIKKSIKK